MHFLYYRSTYNGGNCDQDHDHDRIFRYHNRLDKALSVAYPEHTWLPWKLKTCQDDFFDDISNQREFFEWMKKELGIKQTEDWYQVSVDQVNPHNIPITLER